MADDRDADDKDQHQGREPAGPAGADTGAPSLRADLRDAAQFSLGGRWAGRRRVRILAEIERNRRGEYRVPTWVLAAVLVVFLAAWVLVIVLS